MNEAAWKQAVVRLMDLTKVGGVVEQAKGKPEVGIYSPEKPPATLTVEDALDALRLHVSYLAFDLEATRRENRYLRQMLETRPRRDGDDASEGGSDRKW